MPNYKYKDLDAYLMAFKEASHDGHALPSVGRVFRGARELAEAALINPDPRCIRVLRGGNIIAVIPVPAVLCLEDAISMARESTFVDKGTVTWQLWQGQQILAGCAWALLPKPDVKPEAAPVPQVLNSHFPMCADCTRKYLKFCSFFENKQTCDRKQYLDKKRDAEPKAGAPVLRLVTYHKGERVSEEHLIGMSADTAVGHARARSYFMTPEITWSVFQGDTLLASNAKSAMLVSAQNDTVVTALQNYKLVFCKKGAPYVEVLLRDISLEAAVAEAKHQDSLVDDMCWVLYAGQSVVATGASAGFICEKAEPATKQYWAVIERRGLFPVLFPIDSKDAAAAEIELYRRCQKESAYLMAAVLTDSVGNVLRNLTSSCIESGVAALPKQQTYHLYSFPPDQVAEKYVITACSDDEAIGKIQATFKERGKKAQHWRLVRDSDHTQVAASWRG